MNRSVLPTSNTTITSSSQWVSLCAGVTTLAYKVITRVLFLPSTVLPSTIFVRNVNPGPSLSSHRSQRRNYTHSYVYYRVKKNSHASTSCHPGIEISPSCRVCHMCFSMTQEASFDLDVCPCQMPSLCSSSSPPLGDADVP